MLAKIYDFIEELHQNNVRYCHWKSNLALADSLSGQTDIDLLIQRQDASRFRTILGQHSFKPAATTDGEHFPSVEHYYALDEKSGILVHVHAYYRVITGESLTKNYHFPFEDMLLKATREIDSVPVPFASAELVVFTLRMMLKHTSLTELLLLNRYWKDVQLEIDWLFETASIDETRCLVNCWLPSIDVDLFVACIEALKAPASLQQRIRLARRLRAQLRPYARHAPLWVWLSGLQKFCIMAFRRLTHGSKGMAPQSGGAVVAFVGSEATGKSTLVAETRDWLGEHFSVEQIHAGKPKSTTLTALPNLFLPALRSMLPNSRSTRIEAQQVHGAPSEKTEETFPLLFGIRSVLLAYDRRALLTRAHSRSANGGIVLCDRYPSLQSGAPDSPQLSHYPVSEHHRSLRRLLANLEAHLYREIPPPDLVVHLSAPLDVTISRNASRGKVEPEDYVRLRHARSVNLDFGKTHVCEINTDQAYDGVVQRIKRTIWNTL